MDPSTDICIVGQYPTLTSGDNYSNYAKMPVGVHPRLLEAVQTVSEIRAAKAEAIFGAFDPGPGSMGDGFRPRLFGAPMRCVDRKRAWSRCAWSSGA